MCARLWEFFSIVPTKFPITKATYQVPCRLNVLGMIGESVSSQLNFIPTFIYLIGALNHIPEDVVFPRDDGVVKCGCCAVEFLVIALI